MLISSDQTDHHRFLVLENADFSPMHQKDSSRDDVGHLERLDRRKRKQNDGIGVNRLDDEAKHKDTADLPMPKSAKTLS